MLLAIGTLGGLMILLATLLIVANKQFFVFEDPRIDQVEELLPSANCGACGYTGCRQFATALVKQESTPGKCSVSSITAREQIASFLGVNVGEIAELVARLACAGAANVARFRASYTGIPTCQAAAQVAGGGKTCTWGCLGYGDCEAACEFDALHLNQQDLPVVSETLCTGCGDCVIACPKDLFSVHPVSHRLWVACKNLEFGDDILAYCEVACTACERCAKDAKNDLIVMRDNLAVIDYDKPHDTRIPIERCPTGAIVWMQADGSVIKGREAKKIIRQQPLMAMSS